MKRFLSLFVCLTLVFSISVPAFAQEAQPPGGRSISYSDNGVSITADDGDILTFEVSETNPNAPQIKYYYNGEYVCTYYLSQNGSGPVAVNRMGETRVVEDLSMAFTPNGSRIGSVTTTLGRLCFYRPRGYSESLDPSITVTNRIVASDDGLATIRTEKNTVLADALVLVADSILSAALGKIDIDTSTILKDYAADLLDEAIHEAGGKIVNGVINVALNDTYTVVIMEEELQSLSAPIGNKTTYTYKEMYVVYGPNDYRPGSFDGKFTRDNWSTEPFAEAAWNDTFGEEGYDNYPGIKEIEFY